MRIITDLLRAAMVCTTVITRNSMYNSRPLQAWLCSQFSRYRIACVSNCAYAALYYCRPLHLHLQKVLLLPVISPVKLRYIYTGNRVFVFTVGLVATSGDYLRQQLARSIAIADLRSTPSRI
jgi:hypothetical protein